MDKYKAVLKRLNTLDKKRKEAERKATEQVNGNVSYGMEREGKAVVKKQKRSKSNDQEEEEEEDYQQQIQIKNQFNNIIITYN